MIIAILRPMRRHRLGLIRILVPRLHDATWSSLSVLASPESPTRGCYNSIVRARTELKLESDMGGVGRSESHPDEGDRS
jgi:hypothetical protein